MLHTKYQSSTPSNFREDFQRFRFFFFLLPWQPELWVELNSLNNFGRASPKEHSCQVSWRLAKWFWRRRCLKKLLTDDRRWTLGDHNSSPLTLCAKVSQKKKKRKSIEFLKETWDVWFAISMVKSNTYNTGSNSYPLYKKKKKSKFKTIGIQQIQIKLKWFLLYCQPPLITLLTLYHTTDF